MPSPTKTYIEQNPPLNGNCGWGPKDDPVHHRLYKERLAAHECEEIGVFTALPDALAKKGEETAMEKLVRSKMPWDDGWDFDFVDRLFYGYVPYVYQNPHGTCVGAGDASAAASKVPTELLLLGEPENPFGLNIAEDGMNHVLDHCGIPFVGFTYGAGRCKNIWTGSEFRGSVRCDDGSLCSWQTWAAQTCGYLPCDAVQGNPQVPQSEDVVSWGCNRNGILNKYLEVGQRHLMTDTVRCRSGDDIHRVITELKQPIINCSSWAFKPDHFVEGLGWVYARDTRTTWNHNMVRSGRFKFKGNWWTRVRNQWGKQAHKDGWSFIIPAELDDIWVKQSEAQSKGNINLLKPNDIPAFPY